MIDFPKRKINRLENFDYSTPSSYFVTVCVAERERILWAESNEKERIENIELSEIGKIVENEINKINLIYKSVYVEKHCIMPDHLHMIITIMPEEDVNEQKSPTISRIIQQFKGSITKQIKKSIWQKSFYDHVIRDQQDYDEIWKYIEENILKYVLNL